MIGEVREQVETVVEPRLLYGDQEKILYSEMKLNGLSA